MMRCLLALLALISVASAADNLKAFPPPEKGMKRLVLNLPETANEADLKVEVLIGKMVKIDAVNRYFFGGRLETKTLQGWGFDYHILRQLGPITGTLMAPPPDSPQVERFITLRGEPQLLRYNSRLPLVIYVPKGVEVRYRLWRADAQAKPVGPG